MGFSYTNEKDEHAEPKSIIMYKKTGITMILIMAAFALIACYGVSKSFAGIYLRRSTTTAPLKVEVRTDGLTEELLHPSNSFYGRQRRKLPPATPAKPTCFSGLTNVVTPEGRKIMADLAIGDAVWTGSEFQSVYGFGHRHTSLKTHFIVIETTLPESPLEVTHNHLLFMDSKKHPIPASLVKIGDKLRTSGDQTATVTKITLIERLGIYAPMTARGTIQVNGIVASSYVTPIDGEAFVKLAGGIVPTPLSFHLSTHVWMTIPRLWCSIVSCPNETYLDSDGWNVWSKKALDFYDSCEKQHTVVQIGIFFAFLLLSVFFLLIDWCFFNSIHAFIVLCMTFMTRKAMFYYLNKKKEKNN